MCSNMYPSILPRIKPTLYDNVMMLPAVSRRDEGTFDGANIIGRLPATPLLSPRAAVKKKDMASPEITGLSRGAQQSRSNGMSSVLSPDISVNCLRDHA